MKGGECVEGGTGRSLGLVSTFISDGVFIVESSGSSQVIRGCGDCTGTPSALAGGI